MPFSITMTLSVTYILDLDDHILFRRPITAQYCLSIPSENIRKPKGIMRIQGRLLMMEI